MSFSKKAETEILALSKVCTTRNEVIFQRDQTIKRLEAEIKTLDITVKNLEGKINDYRVMSAGLRDTIKSFLKKEASHDKRF